MKKLLFGKPIGTAKNVICDFCDEEKECFVGLTREVTYVVKNTKTALEDVGGFLNPRLEFIEKDSNFETKHEEITFHICPDCIKQLESFIKEI